MVMQLHSSDIPPAKRRRATGQSHNAATGCHARIVPVLVWRHSFILFLLLSGITLGVLALCGVASDYTSLTVKFGAGDWTISTLAICSVALVLVAVIKAVSTQGRLSEILSLHADIIHRARTDDNDDTAIYFIGAGCRDKCADMPFYRVVGVATIALLIFTVAHASPYFVDFVTNQDVIILLLVAMMALVSPFIALLAVIGFVERVSERSDCANILVPAAAISSIFSVFVLLHTALSSL